MRLALAVLLLLVPAAPALEAIPTPEDPAVQAPPGPVGVQDAHRVVITHDTASGRTYVGAYATFGVLVLGADGAPLPHQDVDVRLVQDGRVLHGLGPAHGHDYDGVQEFQVRFDRPGPFEVRATSGGQTAVFGGVVEERRPVDAALALHAPDEVVARQPFEVRVRPLADGELALHTDAIVQVLDTAGREVLRAHTHTHDEEQVLQVAVPEAGRYTLRATASTYFADGAPELPQVVVERQVTATSAQDIVLPRPVAAPGLNPVHEGSAGPLRLFGTADPFDVVRVGMPVDLAVTVLDGDAPAQHMDFEAVLEGPSGVLFSSTSLHEYDGVLHLRTLATMPGEHVLRVTAVRGDDRGTLEVPYTVQGGLLDAPAGARLDVPASIGCGEALRLTAQRLDGSAYGHTEVRFEVMQDGLPLRAGKAHTHGDGRFALALGLDAGDHVLHARLDPTRADPEGVARTSVAVPFTVACAADAPLQDAADASASIPAAGVAGVLALLGAGLAVLRRRD